MAVAVRPIPDIACERLAYDPDTGEFRWVYKNKMHPRLFGMLAGSVRDGYLVIKINGIPYRAHRLAWFMSTGEQPETIDHINGDKLDNRLCNLRNVTALENAKNHGKKINGSGLPCGVRRVASGKFNARVKCNGTEHNLGLFTDPASAHQAYIDKRNSLFGKYARR